MNLLALNSDGSIEISPEASMLKPFKEIFKRDRSAGKNKANMELAFIYHFASFKSDFRDIIDEEERANQIARNLGFKDDWRIDKKLKDAIDFYKERTRTTTMTALEDAEIALSKISKFIRDADPTEENVKDIATVLGKYESMVKTIKTLREIVEKEMEEESSMRGNKQKSFGEDGI